MGVAVLKEDVASAMLKIYKVQTNKLSRSQSISHLDKAASSVAVKALDQKNQRARALSIPNDRKYAHLGERKGNAKKGSVKAVASKETALPNSIAGVRISEVPGVASKSPIHALDSKESDSGEEVSEDSEQDEIVFTYAGVSLARAQIRERALQNHEKVLAIGAVIGGLLALKEFYKIGRCIWSKF